jgi:hypothetical protein
MFQAGPQPVIRTSKMYTQHPVFVELFLLLTAIVGELEAEKARKVPDAVYTVVSS